MRTLGDFSGVADENSGAVVALSSDADTKDGSPRASDSRNEARSSSVSAYNDINRTLGNFYESPQEDPEKEALKAEAEQLKRRLPHRMHSRVMRNRWHFWKSPTSSQPNTCRVMAAKGWTAAGG